jgi:2-keto-4-pentenoate hydratase/2-oxohepta-3-ene-1,7-dioic acid hydratase in catechol pathway
MKIFCVGRNYSDHAQELGNAIPTEPVVFLKPKSAVTPNNTPLFYPDFTNELHYEAELIVRIGKNGKFITKRNAMDYVDMVSVGIDFTARDIQTYLKGKGLPWEKAKAFDGSAVIGKWKPKDSVTLDKGVDFSLQLNGKTVQHANTKDLIFDIPTIIEDIGKYFTLNIGDVIFTGTPAGVGECTVTDVLEGYLGSEKLMSVEIK